MKDTERSNAELIQELQGLRRRIQALEGDQAASKRKPAKTRLAESERRSRALFEQGLLPIARFRPDGSMIAANEAVRRLFGATPEAHQIMIRSYNILRDEQMEAKGLAPLIRRAFGGEAVHLPAVLHEPAMTSVAKDLLPRDIWVESFLLPIPDRDGTILEVVAIQNDLTDRMEANRALREGQERLGHALDAGAIGLFDWNIPERRVTCTDRTFELFGLEPGTDMPSEEHWIGRVHPEDQQRARQEVRAALEDGVPYETECRVVWPDGAVRWLSGKAEVLFDTDGKPYRMIGALVDITERKRAEEMLREKERQLSKAQQIGFLGYWLWDVSRNQVTVSDNLCVILGVPRGHFDTDPYERAMELSHPEDRPKLARLAKRLVVRRQPFEVEHRAVRPDHEVRHLVSRGEVAADAAGNVTMFVTAQDVTAHKLAEQALRESQAALERNREQLRALTARLFAAQEEERRRLSRELHDDLNQRLAVLAMHVETLQQQPPATVDRLLPELGALRDQMAELSDGVRRVAYQLHPSILEHLGLAVTLSSFCLEFSQREGIPVRFDTESVPDSLPHDVALCLYRVVQEALRNLARHSRSNLGMVILAGTGQGVRLSIADNGVGFDPEAARSKGGLGLVSMEERVRLAGGTLLVDSQPGKGTRIQVHVPLAVQPA